MKKNMTKRERKCRKNIAQMLSLMGFKDNNIAAAAIVRNMLAKLRQVEESNTNKFPTTAAVAVHKNKNRSKIVFKFGGKSCVDDQESSPPVTVPLEPPHSKTLVVSCNKNNNDMELKDSRNINPSSSKMMNVGDHEIMELKKPDNTEILGSRRYVVCSQNPNVEIYSRNDINVSSQNPSTSSSRRNVGDQEDDVMMELKNGDNIEISDSRNEVVYSENPGYSMIHDELRIYNVKEFITSIGGTKAKLFIKKQVTHTDVQKNHGRLLMPAKQAENSDKLLTSDEKMFMGSNDNKLSVTVFDPRRRKWELNLGQWKMGGNINYVLKTHWFPLADTNKLKEGESIQVWSFRDVEENLCFVVVRV